MLAGASIRVRLDTAIVAMSTASGSPVGGGGIKVPSTCSQVGWKLDRLGPNTLHILETVKALTDRGVRLVSTTDGIDSSSAAGRMVIGVLASMAEFERELIKERTALKRETSRANGTRFGRPRKVDDAEHITTAKKMKADGHTAKDIAKYLGVSRATLYRYLTEDRAA